MRFRRFAIFDFLTPKKKKKRFFFRIFFSVFHDFRQILEELGIFGRENQIPGGILLQIDKFSGLYDVRRPFLVRWRPEFCRVSGNEGSGPRPS